MEKRWKIAASDAVKTEALQAALSINKTICSILVARGIETFDAAKNFYRPQISDLHDPWLMKDMVFLKWVSITPKKQVAP